MPNSLKNISHLIGITRKLARNDALFPVELLDIKTLTLFARTFRKRRRNLRPGQKLVNAFQELGPSFIKLGQALSTRSDLVGEEIAADLAMLRDQLPPFPTAQAKAIIEAELGNTIQNLFLEFTDIPVAAASIAQVHFAKVKTGEDVAVKILRPGIERRIAKDIELFLWIANIIEKTQPNLRPADEASRNCTYT